MARLREILVPVDDVHFSTAADVSALEEPSRTVFMHERADDSLLMVVRPSEFTPLTSCWEQLDRHSAKLRCVIECQNGGDLWLTWKQIRDGFNVSPPHGRLRNHLSGRAARQPPVMIVTALLQTTAGEMLLVEIEICLRSVNRLKPALEHLYSVHRALAVDELLVGARVDAALRVLHWNVFEDGLADTPGTLSFSADFTARFDALLKHISEDGAGRPFLAFAPTRDFTQLPNTKPIGSSATFFGFLETLYNAVYHPLGGQARFGTTAPGEPPDLGNTLRSLFLRSTIDDATLRPSEENRWRTPLFEAELAKVTSRLSAQQAADTRTRISNLADGVLHTRLGVLSWDYELACGLWKRENNVWRDKWEKELRLFLRPPAGIAESTRVALRRFCTVVDTRREGELSSLIEAQLDASGRLVRLRSLTLQSAVRWLLVQMVDHSQSNAKATQAIEAFLVPTAQREEGGAPAQRMNDATPLADAEAHVGAIFAELLSEMAHWFDSVALERRHAACCKKVEEFKPAVVSLVEHDAQWRQLPMPSVEGRSYVMVHGKGDATIAYDSNEFEALTGQTLNDAWRAQLGGVPRAVRSDAERGVGPSTASPKSSCMLLLCRKADGLVILILAVHLTSGKPSDGAKVAARAAELRAVRSELSLLAVRFSHAGLASGGGGLGGLGLIVCGDFNALREEFVMGNTDDFFGAPAIAAALPPFSRRAPGAAAVQSIGPPVANLKIDGTIQLSIDGIDTPLSEAAPGVNHVAPTRAGTNTTIDYALVGSIGSVTPRSQNVALFNPIEGSQAADVANGLRFAVLRWGSDHLPVACDTWWS